MAVSRLQDTTPAQVGERWVHQPIGHGQAPGEAQELSHGGHLTHVPLRFLALRVTRVPQRRRGGWLRRSEDVILGREPEPPHI